MNFRRSRLLIPLALVIGISALLAGLVTADPSVTTRVASVSPAASLDARGPTGADDGALDVGVEFVADAPPAGAGGSDLPGCRTSGWDFYNRMRGAGYTGSDSFIWGDSLAWERDFKRAALGGNENHYIDNVDITYYCDHGYDSGMFFPWGHDDNGLEPSDCLGSWGDKDAEWLGIGTCLTLINHGGWANCMNGLHLIAGYITVSQDVDEGGPWADQMLGWYVDLPLFGRVWLRQPKTITQAWFTMCDQQQPSSVTARVIAEDSRHYGDKLWNRGGPAYGDIVDDNYFWLDHSCYKPDPMVVDTAPLVAMPSYRVVQRTVDESYARNLANTLGFSDTLTLMSNGQEWAISSTQDGVTRTLSVQVASGGYTYQNLAELWLPPEPGLPLSLPGTEQAAQLADSYLLANAQNLPGVRYATDQHTENDVMTPVSKNASLSFGSPQGTTQESSGVDVMVAYGRHLAAGVQMTKEGIITTEVSVVGPGGSTKVYYGQPGGRSTQGATAPKQQSQLPIGLLGGSRDVEQGRAIQVQTSDKAWRDFQADHQIAVGTIPLDADQITPTANTVPTLAYYEQPHDVSQAEMIPVWAFRADFQKGDRVLAANALVYIPATPDYYPPAVTIAQPTSGVTVRAGEVVSFEATASGGYAPFTYEWVSDRDGVLGTTDSLTHILSPAMRDGETATHTISLKVTNANGQSRVVSTVVNVQPYPLFLPGILKGQGR
ncbi:MAG: DUF6345 domain-containing protein [Anaerolineae bacterium]